jgi:predicted hydrocarbon binding protein
MALLGPLKHLRAEIGKDGARGVIDALPPQLRVAFATRIRKAAWYPYEPFVALLRGIDARLGTGDLTYCEQIGRAAANADLSTVFKVFVRMASPSWLIRACPRVWSRYYEAGSMRATAWEPEETVVVIEDFPGIDPAHCWLMRGWMIGALEVVGGQVLPGAAHSQCAAQGDPRCEFTCRWRTVGRRAN